MGVRTATRTRRSASRFPHATGCSTSSTSYGSRARMVRTARSTSHAPLASRRRFIPVPIASRTAATRSHSASHTRPPCRTFNLTQEKPDARAVAAAPAAEAVSGNAMVALTGTVSDAWRCNHNASGIPPACAQHVARRRVEAAAHRGNRGRVQTIHRPYDGPSVSSSRLPGRNGVTASRSVAASDHALGGLPGIGAASPRPTQSRIPYAVGAGRRGARSRFRAPWRMAGERVCNTGSRRVAPPS